MAYAACNAEFRAHTGYDNLACSHDPIYYQPVQVSKIIWVEVIYYKVEGGVDIAWRGNYCRNAFADWDPAHPAYTGYECIEHVYHVLTKEVIEGCEYYPEQTAGTNPINLGNASKYQNEVDYSAVGIFPLEITRAYNSIYGQWNFFEKLMVGVNGTGVVRSLKNGQNILFHKTENGSWISEPNITGELESVGNSDGDITGWRYITANQTIKEYDAAGRLQKVTDRTGVSHSYTHNGNTIIVAHSNGSKLTYMLSDDGRVEAITAGINETYLYEYNVDGLIKSIIYPDGGIRTYFYENTSFPNYLTGITDENGQRFATWTYDSNGRAISSEHNGGAEKVTIDYTHIKDVADSRVTATNALGKQTTYHFTDIFGARKVTQVEGHPSTNCAAANKNYSYDANGFVASKTDWKGNTTTYVRNTKGQELSRTEASGTAEARTITTEWHPTFNLRTKVTELDRETLYSYDANGNLLSQQTNDLTTP